MLGPGQSWELHAEGRWAAGAPARPSPACFPAREGESRAGQEAVPSCRAAVHPPQSAFCFSLTQAPVISKKSFENLSLECVFRLSVLDEILPYNERIHI